ncbi:hypothetical protein FSARC_10454 [Fusarium sarcochroum]|uniref:Uncharacterized protein n=1 Tax=Fusarium sarcochroum TaxID=1208366 RepID=A0A8H4X3H0_9HYPO|nr:hypothetical protein FSARC_10454 [Fusarium sarcochroum]
MCGPIDSICLVFQRIGQRLVQLRKSGAQAYTPVDLEMNKWIDPLRAEHPPPYQEATAPKEWEIFLFFGSDAELLRKERCIDLVNGYQAWAYLTTKDIIGLMRDGLYLTSENIQVQENHMKQIFSREDQTWYWHRYYTLVDPRWSGTLCVRSWHRNVVSKFRVDDLSADKVFRAVVGDKSRNFVYHFDLYHPEVNANYILDDMPMEGLWPYPRKHREVEEDGKE